jgi:DNA-binding CsgD family transcriptional regulator
VAVRVPAAEPCIGTRPGGGHVPSDGKDQLWTTDPCNTFTVDFACYLLKAETAAVKMCTLIHYVRFTARKSGGTPASVPRLAAQGRARKLVLLKVQKGKQGQLARQLPSAEAATRYLATRLLNHGNPRACRLGGATTLNTRAQRRLTAREREMVSAIAMGYTNSDIAREFSLDGGVVERHLVNLFHELGVVNRFELVIHAIGRGLLDR